MSDDPFTKDSIFISISWGALRAGAVGRLAIIGLVVMVAALIAARSQGWL
jgi:hypothetical protein